MLSNNLSGNKGSHKSQVKSVLLGDKVVLGFGYCVGINVGGSKMLDEVGDMVGKEVFIGEIVVLGVGMNSERGSMNEAGGLGDMAGKEVFIDEINVGGSEDGDGDSG